MRGRLEGTITVPVGGWSVSATNGAGGPSTVTIPASAYSFTSLLSSFQTQLNASRPNGWTVACSYGETAPTGLVTLNCTSVNWAITWTSTDLRDALGFAGNVAARATALAGSFQSHSLWLPDCPYFAPLDLTLEAGLIETDLRQTESPDGAAIKTLYGNKKTVLEGLRWDAVTQNAARETSATVTGFERWWRTTQLGEASYHQVGDHVVLYPNADVAGTSWRYYIVGLAHSKYPQAVQGWTGRYRIEIPRMVNG